MTTTARHFAAATKAVGADLTLCIVKTAKPAAKGDVLWDDACGRTGWVAV